MQKWFKWTALEAAMKVVVKIFHRILGPASAGLSGISLIIAITGFVQVITALVVRSRAKIAKATSKERLGAMGFGLGALASNLFAFGAFYLGGEVIVSTFISTLSIIPGALIDRFVFGHRLNRRNLLGIVVGILAGWFVLECPSFATAARFPAWVWLSFGLTFSLAINQWITQSIKNIHPYEKNLYGGSATLTGALIILFFSDTSRLQAISIGYVPLIVCVVAIGIATFFMWSFNLFAYQDGAYISLKKLVMNASYMFMIFLVGTVFFAETVTLTKILGFLLYVVAITLMDNKLFATVSAIFHRGLAAAR